MTRREALSGLLGTAFMALAPGLGATLPIPTSSGQSTGAGSGPLDGMVFVGDFGPEGEPADRRDALHFASGRFWSANCIPCGFFPGVYWIRRANNGVHFRGTLSSSDSGTFIYSGFIRNGQINVTINWRKERWYWTIDRDFWFEGELTGRREGGSAAQAARAAKGAEPDALDCTP